MNGDLSSAGIMTVNSGGTLSGTGTVPFTLLADGATLAPGPQGSGIGTLTINDRLMFCDCSTFAVKVSGTGNDLARVVAGGFGSGDAFLAGAVRVSLPTATFVVNGAAPARDATLTTASAEMKFISGLSLAATFEGEFSDVTRSYAGKGIMRYQW